MNFRRNLIVFGLQFCCFVLLAQEQGIGGGTYTMGSIYIPNVKNASKISETPEIIDSIGKPNKMNYSIVSKPFIAKKTAESIQPAKMVNEPLSKIYKSLLKLGFGNYMMPYAEFFLNNGRTKEDVYGLRLKHLSASPIAKENQYMNFSDNEASVYGKKFYKKHTLNGEINYSRNAVSYYGFTQNAFTGEQNDFLKQRFNLVESKIGLLSHYTDTTKANYDLRLAYSNLGDFNSTVENNIKAEQFFQLPVNGEILKLQLTNDFYNVKMKSDTINNYIFKLSPYFEAKGKKWRADIGVNVAVDKFTDSKAKFYFFPRLNLNYNVYENMVVPYMGLNGDLYKNSFRSLSTTNPFLESQPEFRNTYNSYNAFLGIRGILSRNISYDAKVSQGKYLNMPLFLINYDDVLNNRFKVVYDTVKLLQVNAQLKYQLRDKISLLAKGNYYHYNTQKEKYAWHKPNFDISLSGEYNIKSKMIGRADFFFIGNQWTLREKIEDGTTKKEAVVLKGIADLNLSFEYRYTKMLSFFIRLNNIANIKYYRWDQYPTQQFNCMLGLTFVPF